MARLKEYGQLDKSGETERLADIEGQEVSITEVKFHEGDLGEFAVMTCVTPDGATHIVVTGAFLVLDALHGAVEAGELPVEAVFRKKGRYWIIE